MKNEENNHPKDEVKVQEPRRVKVHPRDIQKFNSINLDSQITYHINGSKVEIIFIDEKSEFFPDLIKRNLLHKRYYDGLNWKILMLEEYYEKFKFLHSEEFEKNNMLHANFSNLTTKKTRRNGIITAGAVFLIAVAFIIPFSSVWMIILAVALLISMGTNFVFNRAANKQIQTDRKRINVELREKYGEKEMNDILIKQDAYITKWFEKHYQVLDTNEDEKIVVEQLDEPEGLDGNNLEEVDSKFKEEE